MALYYPCSEKKGTDQLRVTTKLICAFVFTYAKIWFCHDATEIINGLINSALCSVNEHFSINETTSQVIRKSGADSVKVQPSSLRCN